VLNGGRTHKGCCRRRCAFNFEPLATPTKASLSRQEVPTVRIVHSTPALRLADGGIFRAVVDACEGLAVEHDTTVLTWDATDALEAWASRLSIRLELLDAPFPRCHSGLLGPRSIRRSRRSRPYRGGRRGCCGFRFDLTATARAAVGLSRLKVRRSRAGPAPRPRLPKSARENGWSGRPTHALGVDRWRSANQRPGSPLRKHRERE